MIKNGKVGNCWRGLYDAHVEVSVLRACRPFVMSASTSGLVSSSSKDARPPPGFHRALLDQRRQKSGGTRGNRWKVTLARKKERKTQRLGRFFTESKISIQFLSVVERAVYIYIYIDYKLYATQRKKEKGIRAIPVSINRSSNDLRDSSTMLFDYSFISVV